jgi:uncharacterized membrane protein YfcA
MDLVESLHVLTHYVTCLCALDVFCGLGLTVLAIGLLRGGIFAVRLLVYGLSLPVHEAVGVSLAAVGATALVGAVQRYWRGETDVCTGVIFAIAGMIGALLGESVHPLNEQGK